MKNSIGILALCVTVFFAGCSTRKVYEPKVVTAKWEKESSLRSEVVDRSYNVAALENRQIVDKNGIVEKIKLESNKRVVGQSDGWIITTSIDGNVTLISDSNTTKNIELKKTIASASVQGDLLAVLFANNDMALYDIDSKELVMKEQGTKALAADIRIVNPYFMNDLVVFGTLDGKIVIINTKIKKRLRTVIVSSEEHFNNVIYFSLLDNKLMAATGTKILSLSDQEKRQKYELRSITDDGKLLYIATKQGNIISLTPDLTIANKIKLPFAHILGMIATEDTLYLLEKEEYVIAVDKKTFEYKVYETDFSDGFVYVGDKAFYIDDTKIAIE